MDKKDYIELNELLLHHEQKLRFEHFSNKDAWELGSFLVKKVYESEIELAIAIRKMNGNIIFQHGTDKTNLNNQNWMNRKFNTVLLMERSSLGSWAFSFISGEQVTTHGLSDRDYIFCGGGFPIRLKTGEIVAVITVSNLPHQRDHMFIADTLKDWLNISGIKDILSFFP